MSTYFCPCNCVYLELDLRLCPALLSRAGLVSYFLCHFTFFFFFYTAAKITATQRDKPSGREPDPPALDLELVWLYVGLTVGVSACSSRPGSRREPCLFWLPPPAAAAPAFKFIILMSSSSTLTVLQLTSDLWGRGGPTVSQRAENIHLQTYESEFHYLGNNLLNGLFFWGNFDPEPWGSRWTDMSPVQTVKKEMAAGTFGFYGEFISKQISWKLSSKLS